MKHRFLSVLLSTMALIAGTGVVDSAAYAASSEGTAGSAGVSERRSEIDGTPAREGRSTSTNVTVSDAKQSGRKDTRAQNVVSTTYGDKWAVVVGVNAHSDPALKTVLHLDSSAKRVSEALLKKGFASDHVRVMLNRDATRQAVLSSLSSQWLGKLSRKSDLVVLFFGNQCFPANDGKVYLLPYDTRLSNFFPSAISVDEIFQTVKANVAAKDIVFVFQTSFSGAPEMMAGVKTMFGRYNISIHHNDLQDNYTVMCSSKPGQPTWGTYFSDNLAEDMNLGSDTSTLVELFTKIKDDTVRDTTKDCAGCKVQSPVILSKRNPEAIALGTKPTAPVATLPAEIAVYLKGQNIYSETQMLLDEYRVMRAKQETSSHEPQAFHRIEEAQAKTPTKLSAEFLAKVDSQLEVVRDYLKENPNFAPGHYLLGRLLQFKDEHQAALAAFQEAVRLNYDSCSYHSWVARAKERLGLDAKAEWQEAFRLNNKSLSAIDNLAFDAEKSGAHDKAAELLNQAIAVYPGDAALRVRLSHVLVKQGKLKQAVEQAQEAVFLDEHSFDALVNLGNLLIASKDEKAAHAAFREALELGARETEYYYVLAEALEKTNDPDGAIQAWTRFVDGSPKDAKRLDDAKKRLDELKKASQ